MAALRRGRGHRAPDRVAAPREFGREYGQGYYYGLPTDAQVALRSVDLRRAGVAT